jgi:hypothetical protein
MVVLTTKQANNLSWICENLFIKEISLVFEDKSLAMYIILGMHNY